MDIEKLAQQAAGKEAWDVWRDSQGRLHIGVDGISLLPELEVFALLIAESVRIECANEIERKSGETYSVILCEHREAADWLRSNVELRRGATTLEESAAVEPLPQT